MKFKDNLFFKAYELRNENSSKTREARENQTYHELHGHTYTYNFETGINIIMELLFADIFEIMFLDVTILDKKHNSVTVNCTNEAFKYLKDKDITDIEAVTLRYPLVSGAKIGTETVCFELNSERDVVIEKASEEIIN